MEIYIPLSVFSKVLVKNKNTVKGIGFIDHMNKATAFPCGRALVLLII
jgi:hypothetical protein